MKLGNFVSYALNQLGAPYIWGAKGNVIWTPDGLKPLPRHLVHQPEGGVLRPKFLDAFDCSGLVTAAIFAAGGQDLRATHSARTLYSEACAPLGAEETPKFGDLLFYGQSGFVGAISHVSIYLGEGVVVEAAGGDRSTTSYEEAAQRGAKVRVGLDLRRPIAKGRLRQTT